MTRLLSSKDISQILDMKATMDIQAQAFADLSDGKTNMPQRVMLRCPDANGGAGFMPAYLPGMAALGAKIVTAFPDNPVKFNLPTILGLIVFLDDKTGKPLAIMDGVSITAMRTGAGAGVATRLLAREDAKVHTLFGTGGMAQAQAWAVATARNIEKLILVSLDPPEKKAAFCASLADILSCEITLADDPQAAVWEADVITLVTTARTPIINGDWIKPGTHINGVGSHAPAVREIDTTTVQRSRVVCDLVSACKAEAGDLIIPVESGEWNWDRVAGSLGDVLTGKASGRISREDITLFKSVGLAIQDISTASHVYQKAVELGIGTEFTF
jgi:alanine dehydrogenase